MPVSQTMKTSAARSREECVAWYTTVVPVRMAEKEPMRYERCQRRSTAGMEKMTPDFERQCGCVLDSLQAQRTVQKKSTTAWDDGIMIVGGAAAGDAAQARARDVGLRRRGL